MKKTSIKGMIEYLKNLKLDEYGSEKMQLDNLDWAKLVNDEGTVRVENEHGTIFDLEELSKTELKIFWMNL